MKIVINTCYGGFSLSEEGTLLYAKLKGVSAENLYSWDLPRDDPTLIQAIEQLGSKAAGGFAKLRIVEIPDNVQWHISEYDGMEHVAEDHRTWS